MKKENTLNEKENNILKELENILNEYNQVKVLNNQVKEKLKLESKLNTIQKANEYCFKLFESMNKNGFLKLVKHDFYKYYLKKFYEKNHVFIKEEKDGIFILYENENSLKACLNFKDYALKTIQENKEKQKQKKQALLNKNIKEFSLLKYNIDELKAIILQAQNQVKNLNKNK